MYLQLVNALDGDCIAEKRKKKEKLHNKLSSLALVSSKLEPADKQTKPFQGRNTRK